MVFFFLFSDGVYAQKKNERYVAYIETYCDIAVEQMKLHKIPASITLAQGILESSAGQSDLAQRSRNHFGIKCGNDWTGASVTHYDDGRNECFRSYTKVRDSYEDHSLFLVNRPWYSSLFELPITDYKRWATGLKEAGYATDPLYPTKLITLIETYELHQYDKSKPTTDPGKKDPVIEKPTTGGHTIYKANGLIYVTSHRGDTFESIAEEIGMRSYKLAGYNELPVKHIFSDGEIVYLEKKNTKASKGFNFHRVKDGESMHSISQLYGIRLKNLYKLNRQDTNYVPEIGTLLRVR